MKIVADRDIYRVAEFFAGAGDLELLPGRSITREHLVDADALLVRTVTRVGHDLVKGTSLRFIGSATSGFDHVDLQALEHQGIHFSHAPGCNAEAVVDYVFATLAWLGKCRSLEWRGCRTGIIGAGNVGGRLARKLQRLGMTVVIHDPLLPAGHPLAPLCCPLEEALDSDVVSLHTPLTRSGHFPTFHMLDLGQLRTLNKHAVLINAARGEVIDNQALESVLRENPDLLVALDVWEGEPSVRPILLESVDVATPHIAGYSLNGKLNGTKAVFEAFSGFFGLAGKMGPPDDDKQLLEPAGDSGGIGNGLNDIILQAYPIHEDFLAPLPAGQEVSQAVVFDARRNGYRFRREFSDFLVNRERLPLQIQEDLGILGFELR